jgi:hypothetical protein
MKALISIFIVPLLLACAMTQAGEPTSADIPELERTFKAFVQYLDSLPYAPDYAVISARQQQEEHIRQLADKVVDALVSTEDAGIDALEKLTEPLLRRHLHYRSAQQRVWDLVRGVCFNRNWSTEKKEALMQRYLADRRTPFLVKAWLVIGTDSRQAVNAVIPENLMLDVCQELLPVREPVLRLSGFVGIRHYVMLATGRDIASDLIQSLYQPEGMDWPHLTEEITPEVVAQREEAAKFAEKWIEKRRIRDRLQSALLDAIENHRDADLNDSARISQAFDLFLGYTKANRQDIVERFMKLLLVEVAMEKQDAAFIRPLARAIEQLCEKNGSEVRSAEDRDLKNTDACRKWLAEVIRSSMKRPSSYLDNRAWQNLAETLSLPIEEPVPVP